MQRLDLQPTDFVRFFTQALFFAESGANPQLVLELLDHIQKQILRFLSNPEENPEYLRVIMNAVLEASLPERDDLNPIKAKLSYLKGLIHYSGLGPSKQPVKQAIVDFENSIKYGGTDAYEHLGDIYYQDAIKLTPPISASEKFAEALNNYQRGHAAAKIKYIENGLLTVYNEAINNGNFKLAIDTAKAIKTFINKPENNDIVVNQAIIKFIQRIPEVEHLAKLVEDARIVEEGYRLIRLNKSFTPEQVEKAFFEISSRLQAFNGNPVYDYYLLKIQHHVLTLKQSRGDDKRELEAYRQKAKSIEDCILNANFYDDVAQPLLNYVKGKGRDDNLPVFLKLPASSLTYYRLAAKGGCYLAYAELGAIDEEKAPFLGDKYYEIGAQAGSLKSQLAYLKSVIKRFNMQIDEEQILNLIELSNKLIDKINASNNLSSSDKEDFKRQQDKLAFMIKTHPDTYKLYLEKQRIQSQLAQLAQQTYPVDDKNKTPKENLQARAKLLWAKRAIPFAKHVAKRGNIIPDLYREHIDPLHAMAEYFNKNEFKRWEKSPTTSNLYRWLLESATYKTTGMHRVLYLDEEERKKYHVKVNVAGKLEYDDDLHQPVPDSDKSSYLYILDTQGNLYLAPLDNNIESFLHLKHPSLTSGSPILCGGEVIVKNGKITRIDNYSGHYHPNIHRLYHAIIKLKAANMLAPDFRIKIVHLKVPGEIDLNLDQMTLDEFRALYLKVILTKKSTPPSLPINIEAPKEYTPQQKVQMQLIEKEIENYKRAEAQQQLQNFPELVGTHDIKPNFIAYLSTDAGVENSIKKTVIGAGNLGCILVNLKIVQKQSLQEFATSYVEAIETGRFKEWTLYKASIVLNQLLDVNHRIHEEILDIFARRADISREKLVKHLYGEPEDPVKVKNVAQSLYSACVHAIASQFYSIIQQADRKDLPNDYIKLKHYDYLITGVLNDLPIDSAMTTFKDLADLPFSRYEDEYKKISASNMIEIELQAINLNIIRASAPKPKRNDGFFVQPYNPIEELQHRRAFLLSLLPKAEPRKTAIIEGLKIKLDFYKKIGAIYSVHPNKINAIANSYARQIDNIQSFIVDNKRFNNQYRVFDEMLFATLHEVIRANADDVESTIDNYKTIENLFYQLCNTGEYEFSVKQLKSNLDAFINQLTPIKSNSNLRL